MTKKLFCAIAIVVLSNQAQASFDPITTPDEMVQCFRNHLMNWVIAPASPSWEHRPAFETAGRYIQASWHSNGYPDYGMAFMFVGDNSPVACNYEKNADGSVDTTKPGFCKPTVENAEVKYTYSRFDNHGNKIDVEKRFARVVDSKLVCLNLPRP